MKENNFHTCRRWLWKFERLVKVFLYLLKVVQILRRFL